MQHQFQSVNKLKNDPIIDVFPPLPKWEHWGYKRRESTIPKITASWIHEGPASSTREEHCSCKHKEEQGDQWAMYTHLTTDGEQTDGCEDTVDGPKFDGFGDAADVL